MGWRHERICDNEYDAFVDQFITAVKGRWPNVLLQLEDFAQKSATKLLHRYRDQLCCFNDDIQGTAAVTLATLIAASGGHLKNKTIAFVGAGSAGCGIAEQIVIQMQSEGLTQKEARERILMLDRFGLLTDRLPHLMSFQKKLIQKSDRLQIWNLDNNAISLLNVIKNARPDILIGLSGQPGLFTQEVIHEMCLYSDHPVIMPLSNPTSQAEALPENIVQWSQGTALIATGRPFKPVNYKGQTYPVAQCNNAYIFPGVGLGVLASGARRITDAMFMAASRALASQSPLMLTGKGPLLPNIDDIHRLSKNIAFAIGKTAQFENEAPFISEEAFIKSIERNYWKPEYRHYKRTAF